MRDAKYLSRPTRLGMTRRHADEGVKHLGEVLGHVVVLGGAFEVAKHLCGELADSVVPPLRVEHQCYSRDR